MAELVINDSTDVEEATNLLSEAGLTATNKEGSDNVLIVDDESVAQVEAVLDASDIDYDWTTAKAATAEGEEEEDEDEDEDENGEEDEDED